MTYSARLASGAPRAGGPTPVRGPTRLLRTLGTAGALELAHLMLLPAGVMARQLFDGDAARLLLLGNSMHRRRADRRPGQRRHGLSTDHDGPGRRLPGSGGRCGPITAALVHRAVSAGAQIDCERPVSAIDVKGGRAVAVRTADGGTVRVRRAVIAETSAPQLYQSLLPADALPASLLRNLEHFVWDTPVLKVNYALNATIPWRSKSQ